VAASAKPIHCIEKERLLKAFAAAVGEYNRMNSARVAALRRGDELTFAAQLEEAAERMDNARYAIIAHREQHGC
jgi:hypothetical protein